MLTFRSLVFPAIRDFHRYLGSFVAWAILFSILNALVLGPMFAFAFSLAVRHRGGGVLSNDEIFAFFLSPVGIVALVVLIMAALTTVLTYQAGVMIIFASQRTSRPVGSVRALLAMLSRLPGILLINFLRALVVLIVVSPFAGVGAGLYFRFLGGYDLNYLVQVRPAPFWWGVAVGALLLLAAAFCVLVAHTRVVFAFPAYFFGDVRATRTLSHSFALARGHTLRLVWLFSAWIAVAGAFNLALGAIVDRMGPAIVPLAGQRIALVALVIGIVLVVRAFVHAALGAFTFGVSAIAVARAYLVLTPEEDLALPEDSAREDRHGLARRWAIVAVAAISVGAAVLAASVLFEASGRRDEVTIVAHRGASSAAPENTLAAIGRAIEVGADYAEIDVQETADGVVVVLHDSDLARVAGRPEKIWELPYDEIRELDVGSWFGPEFAGEHVPTLVELLRFVDWRIPLVIEIKPSGRPGETLVEDVVRIIDHAGVESTCIVASLSRDVVEDVGRLDPRLARGYMIFRTIGEVDRVEADYVMVEAGLATPLTIRSVHDAGKKIYAWTVDDTARMSYLIDRGVDGFMTDDPAAALDLLRQRAELSGLERLVLRFAEIVSR